MLDELRTYRLLYLGSPYRNYPQGIGMAARHVSKIAGRLTIAGLRIFSPIAHGHMMSVYGGIHPRANELWEKINAPFMDASDALLVAKMETWETSEGLAAEIRNFERNKKPVYHLDPVSLAVSNAA